MNNQVNGKQFNKINGFIDLGSAKAGERLKFIDDNGQWRQTSPIVNAQVNGTYVYIETQNSVYANYDIELMQNQTQAISQERLLAEKTLEIGKDAIHIADFDINKLIFIDKNNQGWYIHPSQVEPGMHLQLETTIRNMETGVVNHGVLNIPSVQDFQYDNGNLTMQSGSKVFSSIDFSRELNELKIELSQGYGYDMRGRD